MTALEFVQKTQSLHLVVAEINDNKRYKAEDLAAAYAIDSLTTEEIEFLDESLQKHLDDLLFHQANFDEQRAMEICQEIVSS
jgi:hypothetical protein